METLSLEGMQLPFGLYIRKYVVFKINELSSKKVTLDEDFLLPKNSTLHFLDCFFNESITSDVPLIKEDYIYLKHKMPRKKIFHNKNFPTTGDFAVEKKFRYITNGMSLNITKFNRDFRMLMLPLDNYTEPDGELIVQLMNHNPLGRAKFTGVLQHYDKFEAMLMGVLDTIRKNPNRVHFLPIKVTDNLFTQDFTSIVQTNKISAATLKKDSMYYYFVLQILIYLLDQKSELSLFSRFTEEEVNNINFIFHNNQKPATSIIYNLKYLVSLCVNKIKVWHFVTGLNSLFYNLTAPVDIEILQTATENSDITELAKIDAPIQIEEKVSTLQEVQQEIKKTEDEIQEVETKKIMDRKDPEEFEDYIDIRLKEKVTADKVITPVQKEVAIDASKNYKNIPVVINGKGSTIGEVLKGKRITEIKSAVLSEDIRDILIDKSMAECTLKEYDKVYMEKFFYPDLFETFLSFQSNGLLLNNFEEKDEINEINRVKHIRVTLVSPDKKRHTLNLKLPMPDDEGYFMINGVKTLMTKQLVNVPICQVSPTRVNLVSNYNKTIVDKKITSDNNYVNIFLKALRTHSDVNFNYSSGIPYKQKRVPSDYSALGSRLSEIWNDRYHTYNDQSTILKDLSLNESDVNHYTKAKSPLILIGKDLTQKDTYLFMDFNNRVRIINIKKFEEIDSDKTIRIHNLFFNDSIKTSYEHCDLKILDQNVPIIFVLAYKYGLKNVLTYLNIKYELIDNNIRQPATQDEMRIKFANKTLIYNKYPVRDSLILNGLLKFPTINRYNIEEMNKQDVYFNLITDKGLSSNYLIGIQNFFDFFVDPITRHILLDMKEPTNSKDLLIRAVEMLTTEDHHDASSSENLRIRGFERLNSMIYNEIARQYANYSNSHYKERSFSINTEAIFQRLIQDQTVVLAEDINPIHAIKEAERVTYSGFGGRSSESFVEKDRAYSESNLGVLSEATPDSGAVGINRFLSGNPGIRNARGMLLTNNKDAPTKLLSTTSLLMPCSTNDDQIISGPTKE